MICVECTNPEIECLYSEYKSKYIQLTVCGKCGNFADRYIEYDNVILFLDLLLLRPQAYRHISFNVIESSIFQGTESKAFPARYKKLIRFIVLSILFEVYLKWAYEEKSIHHTILKATVLGWPPAFQYLFFVCQQLVEKLVFYVMIVFFYIKVVGWGRGLNNNLPASDIEPYYVCVLISTLLMSLSVKCLPILMLIWPYDNTTVASMVVDVLGALNTIEALRINTSCSYATTILVISVASFASVAGRQLVTSFLVAYYTPNTSWMSLFWDESNALVAEVLLASENIFSIYSNSSSGK